MSRERLITYIDFLQKEVDIYEKSIRNLVDILKPMGNNAPVYIINWLEKNTNEILELQREYMKDNNIKKDF